MDRGGETRSKEIRSCLQALRDAYTAFEGRRTAKQTHVTEFGWATDALSEATQGGNLRVAYDTFRRTAFVARAYWFFNSSAHDEQW